MLIAAGCDDGFVEHYAALLHSAWLHNKHARFILLDAEISKAKREMLCAFAERNGIQLQIIPCRDRLASLIPEAKRLAIFARILIPELLPAEKFALYLDCDITVTSDLRDLFDFDLQGAPLAAFIDTQASSAAETRLWGIDFCGKYFNSGVMLMDLDHWRSIDAATSVAAFSRMHGPEKGFFDQSALNHLFLGQVRPFNPRWQFTFDDPDLMQVKLIHYGFAEKPWLTSKSPFAKLYKFHRAATPFPEYVLRGIKSRPMKWLVRWLGAKLGLTRYRRLWDERVAHQKMLDRASDLLAQPALAKAMELQIIPRRA